jgi:hypothetical protein
MASRSGTVVILGFDGVQLLDLTGPIEGFDAARERGAPYRVLVASPDGSDIRVGMRRRGSPWQASSVWELSPVRPAVTRPVVAAGCLR